MVVFVVAWASVLALVAACAVGLFIMQPSRARARRALAVVAVAAVAFGLAVGWLRL